MSSMRSYDEPQPLENVMRYETQRLNVEAFTSGKISSMRNEDRIVFSGNRIAVVDGATASFPFPNTEKTPGQIAADLVAQAVRIAPAGIYGFELIRFINEQVALGYQAMGVAEIIEGLPEHRPTASLGVWDFGDQENIFTQVGDVNARADGKDAPRYPKFIDRVTAGMRVSAIQAALAQNPELTEKEFLEIGREAIKEILLVQVAQMQNNPNHEWGYGAIDGTHVPDEFVKVYTYPANIQTVELYSDGYFKLGAEPTLHSWEQAFREVEREDPLKIGAYPSTKGSTGGILTDDRTIVIARRKQPTSL